MRRRRLVDGLQLTDEERDLIAPSTTHPTIQWLVEHHVDRYYRRVNAKGERVEDEEAQVSHKRPTARAGAAYLR